MLDPETVREVYERVHMMSMMNDEMKTTGLKKSLPLEQKSTVPASSSPNDVPKKTVEVNLEESSVWDSEEISVLRKVFKQVKEENRKYRVKKQRN